MSLDRLNFCILDVDGTMTDSGLYYGDLGGEYKKFSTRDYVGIMAAHYVGIKLLVVTGRESEITTRRMKELKVDYVFQGVKNKKKFVQEFMKKKGINSTNIGYIGDDLNDYCAMQLAGFKACPRDAADEIKQIADYISMLDGGKGVIQDTFRYILTQMGRWEGFMKEVIENGY